MILLGTPDDLSKFIMVEEDIGFILHQKGVAPMYTDNGCMFFKRTNKLLKLIKKLKLDIEI